MIKRVTWPLLSPFNILNSIIPRIVVLRQNTLKLLVFFANQNTSDFQALSEKVLDLDVVRSNAFSDIQQKQMDLKKKNGHRTADNLAVTKKQRSCFILMDIF